MLFFTHKSYNFLGDNMFDKVHRYLNDEEFRFIYDEDKIYITNYKRIIVLEDNYISFQSKHKTITITGSNLVLKRLVDRDMLIKGEISKIEVKNDK